MARKYATSCTAHSGVLNGSMELDEATGQVLTYESSTAGRGNVSDNGGSPTKLKFKVEFSGYADPFKVEATPDGKGKWKGTGGGITLEEQPWTATAEIPLGTEDDGSIEPERKADL